MKTTRNQTWTEMHDSDAPDCAWAEVAHAA